MAKKRGLSQSRGLEALLGNIEQITKQTDSIKNPTNNNASTDTQALVQMDVSKLQAGKYQPRTHMDGEALAELSQSIKEHGVMQPIVVRPIDGADKQYEIVAGERRFRAAKMANLTHIPAIVRSMDDKVAIALALIENIQRENLNVLEQSRALQRFADEFGLSHGQIAQVVGKSRAAVSNLLRLNALHEQVQAHLTNHALDMGHARALLALPKPQQPIIAQKIIDNGLTVRKTEALVQSILDPASKAPSKQNEDYELVQLNQKISQQLGAKTHLSYAKNGATKLEIIFYSEDELQQLLQKMGVVDL